MKSLFTKTILFSSLLFVFFHAAGFAKTLPSPAENKILVASGAGFGIKTGHPEDTTYQLMLQVKNSKQLPCFIEVEYENPCDTQQPFIENQMVAEGSDSIVLASRSFNFKCLKEGKVYKVKIKVYSDKSKSKMLDELTQEISNVNLEQLGQLENKK